MLTFPIAEKFISINGEGTRSGQLAFFIRFPGCNLACPYCDTAWANQKAKAWEEVSAKDLLEEVKNSGIDLVTLTGGEPLLQPGLQDLVLGLKRNKCSVEIETNGSLSIQAWKGEGRPIFTLDYKLPASKMEAEMNLDNYNYLQPCDSVKFVCSNQEDLDKARTIIDRFHLVQKCHVFLSPVFGKADPADMVAYMKAHKMNGVRLQLQAHKFIWDPQAKGV